MSFYFSLLDLSIALAAFNNLSESAALLPQCLVVPFHFLYSLLVVEPLDFYFILDIYQQLVLLLYLLSQIGHFTLQPLVLRVGILFLYLCFLTH